MLGTFGSKLQLPRTVDTNKDAAECTSNQTRDAVASFVGRGDYRVTQSTMRGNAVTCRGVCCTGCLFGSKPLSLAGSLSDARDSQIRRESLLLSVSHPAAAGAAFTATVASGVVDGPGPAVSLPCPAGSSSSSPPLSSVPPSLPSSNARPAGSTPFDTPAALFPQRPPGIPPLPLPAPPLLALLLPTLPAEAGLLPTYDKGGDDDVIRLVLPLLLLLLLLLLLSPLPPPRGLEVTASMVVMVVVVVVVTTAGGASGPLGGRLLPLPALGCPLANPCSQQRIRGRRARVTVLSSEG